MSPSPRAQAVILQLIFEAAEAGAPAPGNEAMRAACEAVATATTVSEQINRLADRKLIVVERRGRQRRRFQYVASGKWTGWTAAPRHKPGMSAAERARSIVSPAGETRRARARRKCLCCGKAFDSEGIHNRLCASCKVAAAHTAPTAVDSYRVIR